MNQNQNININVCSLNGDNSMALTLKISIHLIQTNDTKEYFQTFSNNINMFRQQQLQTLLSTDRAKLKKINRLTVKINMKLIEYKNTQERVIAQYSGNAPYGIPTFPSAVMVDRRDDGKDDKKEELDEKVKVWLCETVNLPQYETLFVLNGIDDMDIVK
eukprot:UN08671